MSLIEFVTERRSSSLIGRCGMYCGACSVYLACSEGGELRKSVAKSLSVPEDKINCKGCGELSVRQEQKICDILRCLEKREFDFCFECEEYHAEQCEYFDKMFSCHLEENGLDLRQSLRRLEELSEEGWLDFNAKKWICRSCGAPIFIGATRCYRCGNPLGDIPII